jgi:hypothetical protein
MHKSGKLNRKFWFWLLTIFLALIASLALAQDVGQPQPAPPSPPQEQPVVKPPDAETQDSRKAPETTTETKISPKEADDLFREVNQILQFAGNETGLPVKRPVKPRLTGRDEVVKYLQKSMAEDKDAQKLRRSELVLKKFGLLPQDFDLSKFLVALLREQIAGYYDPKKKTVNLLDWVDVAAQRPVLAHELTHALQDQSFDLDKWMKKGDVDLNTRKNLSPQDVQNDETPEARQAVAEGQAMTVMVDDMLRPTGQSLLNSPEVAKALEDGMLVGTPDSIQFKNAPIYLREALTFPYRYGLEFEAELLRQGGKQKAYAGVLKSPPYTTRQIMEPQTYLSGERIEPLPLPDFKHIFKNYDRFDIGAIGEFDVAVLIDQYAGAEASRNLYPHWRGGYYYAVRPKGDSTASLGLLYVSRWSNPEEAAEFAAIYTKYLPKRYQHVRDVAPDAPQPSTDPEDLNRLTGTRTWVTESGPVLIEVKGETVLISESLDQHTTGQLEVELFGAPILK